MDGHGPEYDPLPNMNPAGAMWGPQRSRKTFVLCFDGTGNKFSGTDGDSNILKIYGMLDRSDPSQLHYYQPGIGTYVDTKSFSHTSHASRLNSWFQKAKDSAVGTSFDEHVMGGYKFLMRYYSTGDDIYFFGFSRGAYIARFLAEMLDYVGLLGAGNEEMARFAWKAFAQWQQRHGGTPKDEAKKRKMYDFLTAFRNTFSRPVRRIRFLGLFDTVNSVPQFENAWLRRSKFPYTARSSAKVIRHAVGIDERRAKFRQDLISEAKTTRMLAQEQSKDDHKPKIAESSGHLAVPKSTNEPVKANGGYQRFRRPSQAAFLEQSTYRDRNTRNYQSIPKSRQRSISPSHPDEKLSQHELASLKTASSQMSLRRPPRPQEEDDDDDDADEDAAQDIQEIWFPGCHADIGGGWPLSPGEKVPLSHNPLVWIVREAQKAGLNFDYEKMQSFRCLDNDLETSLGQTSSENVPRNKSIPQLKVTGSQDMETSPPEGAQSTPFSEALHLAATQGHIHDCLEFHNGLPASSVLSWKMMEYLPFRRMDLQPDNSWKSILWPLPKGEVRDIPDGAWIHSSALRRMEAREEYRPGNVIVGGGGRGVRRAPPRFGVGKWDVLREEGDPVGEVLVKRQTGSSGDSR